jgi:hypothetical protein
MLLSLVFQVTEDTRRGILGLLSVLLTTRNFIRELIDGLIDLLICHLTSTAELPLASLLVAILLVGVLAVLTLLVAILLVGVLAILASLLVRILTILTLLLVAILLVGILTILALLVGILAVLAALLGPLTLLVGILVGVLLIVVTHVKFSSFIGYSGASSSLERKLTAYLRDGFRATRAPSSLL